MTAQRNMKSSLKHGIADNSEKRETYRKVRKLLDSSEHIDDMIESLTTVIEEGIENLFESGAIKTAESADGTPALNPRAKEMFHKARVRFPFLYYHVMAEFINGVGDIDPLPKRINDRIAEWAANHPSEKSTLADLLMKAAAEKGEIPRSLVDAGITHDMLEDNATGLFAARNAIEKEVSITCAGVTVTFMNLVHVWLDMEEKAAVDLAQLIALSHKD